MNEQQLWHSCSLELPTICSTEATIARIPVNSRPTPCHPLDKTQFSTTWQELEWQTKAATFALCVGHGPTLSVALSEKPALLQANSLQPFTNEQAPQCQARGWCKRWNARYCHWVACSLERHWHIAYESWAGSGRAYPFPAKKTSAKNTQGLVASVCFREEIH